MVTQTTDEKEGLTIAIPRDVLAASVSDAVVTGIERGVGGWEVASAIEAAVKDALSEADLPRLIHDQLVATISGSSESIVARVSEDARMALEHGFELAFRQAMTGMVYGLLTGKPGTYDTDELKLWDAAVAMTAGSEEQDA